ALIRGHAVPLDQSADPPGVSRGNLGHWQFIFHSLAWLDPLRRRWLATGDASLIDTERALLARQLAEFGTPPAERSPHPTYGFAWADMASAWRTMVLIAFASAVGREPWLITALDTHLDGLLDPCGYGGRGNHALHHCNALASVGLLLDRRNAVAIAQQRLAALRAQFFDDQGVTLEGSAAYHVLNMTWWRDTLRRNALIEAHGGAPLAGIPDGRAFLQDLIADDGRFVPIGDTMFQRNTVAAGLRARFGAEETARLLAPVPGRLDRARVGEGPQGRLAVYDDGYAFSRRIGADGARSFATLRFGRGFAARPHAHDDAGALTFYAGGRRWLEDGGTYGYRGGAFRRFCRSQPAHNCVIVEGASYRRETPSALLHRRFGARRSHVAVEVETLDETRWRRSISHFGEPAALLVHDAIETRREGGIDAVWNLATGVEIANWTDDRIDMMLGDERAVLLFAGDAAANVHHFGSENPLRGWRCVSRSSAVPVHSAWRRVEARSAVMAALLVALPPGLGFDALRVRRFAADATHVGIRLRLGETRFDHRMDMTKGRRTSGAPNQSAE
ncbi:MAG: heparinase II/III family protein, partial [Sphingomonadaceae bacterium]|nr:heparinase II/III family protein [Sphingomonadaceae bacterium]